MNRYFIMLTAYLLCLNPLHAYQGWGDDGNGNLVHPKEMMISENKFTLGTLFDIDTNSGHFGRVQKDRFTLWTHYDYYANEKLMAKGYLNIVSWGQFFTWASTLTLYDASKKKIGSISGCLCTLAPSKFNFYDGDGKKIGKAIMDSNRLGFTLICEKDNRTIAKYTRMLVPNVSDYWYLNVYEEDIPASFLIIFAAFAVDKQGHFRADN